MSSTNQNLQSIVRHLRQKYIFKNKSMKIAEENQMVIQKKESSSSSMQNDINMESQQQAMQLFQQFNKTIADEKQPSILTKENTKVSLKEKTKRHQTTTQYSKNINQKNISKAVKSVSIQQQKNQIHVIPTKNNKQAQKNKSSSIQFSQNQALIKAIHKLLQNNQLSYQQFKNAINSQNGQKFRRQKLFPLLQKVLPAHKLSFTFSYVRQNVEQFNNTPWKQEEIDNLFQLVAKYGRKWKRIGKQLGRSKQSVYRRYQNLSQEGAIQQLKNLWTFNQLVFLLTQISRQTSVPFLNSDISKQLERTEEHDRLQTEQFLSKIYRSNTSFYHNLEVISSYLNVSMLSQINLQDIDWISLTSSVLNKKPIQCKNKIIEIINGLFSPQQTLDELILKFFEKHKVTKQSQIHWNKFKNKSYSPNQAQQRYLVLKKIIERRSLKQFSFIIQQIKNKVNKSKKEKSVQ